MAHALAPPAFATMAFGTVFLAMRVLSIVIGVAGVLPFLAYRLEVRQSVAAAAAVSAAETECVPEAK